jgi:hypothetical protein
LSVTSKKATIAANHAADAFLRFHPRLPEVIDELQQEFAPADLRVNREGGG